VPGGTAERPLSTFLATLEGRNEILNMLQTILHDCRCLGKRIDLIIFVSGFIPTSSSAAICSGTLTLMHHENFWDTIPKIVFAIFEISKLSSDRQAYNAYSALTYQHQLADIIVLWDNSHIRYQTKNDSDPYLSADIRISSALLDIVSNIPEAQSLEELKKEVLKHFALEGD
jgi:hypothetical protein